MVLKKVLDSGTFTALPKSLLYIPPRAVSSNGVVVSVFDLRDGGRTENMWGQAVINGLLIKQVLFQTTNTKTWGRGIVSLPAP